MDSENDNSADETREAPYTGAGAVLRQAREAEGLSLADIAGRTRIPLRQLEVIEAGEFDTLPSRTYAIGFARSYARNLGLDEVRVTDAVRAELGDAAEQRLPARKGMEPGDPAKLPSRGLAWAAAVAAVLLALGLFAWFGNIFQAGRGIDPLPIERGDTPAQGAAAQAANVPSAAPAAVRPQGGDVVFTATEDRVWVRFYEPDGERLFERTLAMGESFTVPAQANDPRINTGRPDALAVTIGGAPAMRLAERPILMNGEPVSAAALRARASVAAPAAQPIVPANAAPRTN